VTRVAELTPAGTGAIATVAVVGPQAWPVVRSRFRPANGKPLPDRPTANRFWFGHFGDEVGDEVVVAVKSLDPEPWVEVHCHGGRRIVRWVVEQLVHAGCSEVEWNRLPDPTRDNGRDCDSRALEPLSKAPTLRTASILLDQYHGAFRNAVSDILTVLDQDGALTQLQSLAELAPVGRHLVAPWRVAVAGAPNVGKSSLINALAGYQRSVVAPSAGTTRDVVTVAVALDGWPVELADTAGLRDAAGLEREGIDRAQQYLAGADLVLWVMDGSDPNPVWNDGSLAGADRLTVVNKSDLPNAWNADKNVPRVSALAGNGIPELATEIIRKLIRAAPAPGAAVPFTPELAGAVETARELLATGEVAAARETLASCLPDE
jgi:tRNA modification GTPase